MHWNFSNLSNQDFIQLRKGGGGGGKERKKNRMTDGLSIERKEVTEATGFDEGP